MKTQTLLLAITLLVGISLAQEDHDFEVNEGIIQGHNDDFEQIIEHFEFALVKFYAPWCGHCKKMAPEYIAAAEVYEFAEQTVGFIEVDATSETQLAQQYGVRGYPTLKFFINGEVIDFTGGRDEEAIIDWIEQKLLPSTTELTSLEEFEAAKSDNKVFGLFLGSVDSPLFQTIDVSSKNFDSVKFFTTEADDILNELDADQETHFLLIKQFDEGRNDYSGEFNSGSVVAFVKDNMLATVMEFDADAADVIFKKQQVAMFLFTGDDDEESQQALDELKLASLKLKGKILLAHSGIEGEQEERIAEYLGITENMVPCLRIVNPVKDFKKYKPDEEDFEINKKSIFAFYMQYKRRKLESYKKSEPVPKVQEHAVYQVVGDTFDDIVLDGTKDVLVKYYAPWCGHCKKLAPIWEELAQDLSGVDNLVIAKMDATVNEVDGLRVSGYPTLKFYPSDNKEPIDHDGGRTVEDLLQWLQDHSTSVVDWSQLDNLAFDDEDTQSIHDDL